MILLDTHIWIWWVSQSQRLSQAHTTLLNQKLDEGLGVSIISCWEIAKLIEYGRLTLDRPAQEWLDAALSRPGVELIPLSTRIVIESTQLPQPFHRDPADQLIVATARVLGCPLMSEDAKITAYTHVQHA